MSLPPGAEQPVQLAADLVADAPAESAVRFGVAGPQVVDVTGLTRAEAEAITALGPLTPAQWASARSTRPVGHRWPRVVDVLGEAAGQAAAAEPAPLRVAPETRQVALSGGGRFAQAVAGLLPAGVEALTDPLRIAAATDIPDLVVLYGMRAVAPHRYRPWQRRGVPQLPVVIGPRRLHIGPVADAAGPCLRCVDLHRTDRDPAWPRILATASGNAPDDAPDAAPAELLSIGAGLVALIVRACLGGAGTPAGLSVSVSMQGPWVLYHQWSRHPGCDCANAPRTGVGCPGRRAAG